MKASYGRPQQPRTANTSLNETLKRKEAGEGTADSPPQPLHENSDPNRGSNALGSLISSRLKESQSKGTVASLISRLEENITSTGSTDVSLTGRSEMHDTFESRGTIPRTGPPMLETYRSPLSNNLGEERPPESEPNLSATQEEFQQKPTNAVAMEEDFALVSLRDEAYSNALKATSADEAKDYELAYSTYVLVVRQFMQVIPRASEEDRQELSETVDTVLRRIEALREALRSAPSTQSPEEAPSSHASSRRESPPQTARRGAAPPTGTEGSSDEVESQQVGRPDRDEIIPLGEGLGTYSPRESPHHAESLSGSLSGSALRSREKSRATPKTGSMTKSLPKEHYKEELRMLQDNIISIMFGGDTTGGGHGKSTAFMMNTHITDLNAGTLGEMKRLAPLPEANVEHWKRDMNLFVRLAQSIIVRVAQTKVVEGRPIEVMVDKPRADIDEHMPLLQKYDEELQDIMASFESLGDEVSYQPRDPEENTEKWWIEQPVLPPGGLSKGLQSHLLNVYEHCSAIYKECHRINGRILGEIDVPNRFLSRLPKHARGVIGKELTDALTYWRVFNIEQYLRERGAWKQSDAWGCASRLEKTSLIWKMRLNQPGGIFDRFRKDTRSKVTIAQKRAETAVRTLKEKFPSMPHTKLDEMKIADNTDYGKSIMEAYSRALETRAARVLERVSEILDADTEIAGQQDGRVGSQQA